MERAGPGSANTFLATAALGRRVNATLVGVLGALVVVGSMVAVLEVRGGEEARDQDDVVQVPAGLGRDRWSADECHALSLVWTPPLAALDDVVGPQWTPIEGPLPGRGLFVLFAYHCDEHVLNGVRRPASDAGAVIVRIADPADTHGVDNATGWSAVPEWTGDPTILDMVDDHGFTVAPGTTEVTVTETALGLQVDLRYTTDEGEIIATATLAATTEPRDVYGALVATSDGTFGVFEGPETMTRHATGTAIVEATGDTWVSTLDLEPVPFGVAYDRDFAWDFTFWSEALG